MPDERNNALQPQLSPAARDAAIERLTAAFAHDLLTLDDFEHRAAAAYAATSPGALEQLTQDLPGNVVIARGGPNTLTRVASLFSNIERGGILDIPARLEVRAMFGNIELDLRAARFAPGVTEISVRSLFGNVEILLPPDIVAQSDGEAVLANFTCRPSSEFASRTTFVRVTGRAILSSVEVK